MSIGTSPNPLIKSTTKGLEVNSRGGIIVEENTGKTSKKGVYAGGDAVTGAATVILAMGAGKTAAKAIDDYLTKKYNFSKKQNNVDMSTVFNLTDVVAMSQEINIYNDGNVFKCYPDESEYNEIVSAWSDMTNDSHEMPAFGVSLDRETRKAKESGLWVEFVFGKQLEYNGMPFENLLINVAKGYQGFNLIRYSSKYGYDGRCFYLDLVNKNMTNFYNILCDFS